MKAKRHPHVAEELRIAERTVGLHATCAICGKLTGYECRAHFVAEIARLREALDVIATCPPEAVHLMPLAAQAALSPTSPQPKEPK